MFTNTQAQKQAERGGWKKGFAPGQLLASSETRRPSRAVNNKAGSDISMNEKGCQWLRHKQNIHKARLSRDATGKVHRSWRQHAFFFFFPRTSMSAEVGCQRAPRDGRSPSGMGKEGGNRDGQGCARSQGYAGRPRSLSCAGVTSSHGSWHMPLLGGELQWPLLHNPQHYQQPQKDFPQFLVQILAGPRPSPPARRLGFFPIFFFFCFSSANKCLPFP